MIKLKWWLEECGVGSRVGRKLENGISLFELIGNGSGSVEMKSVGSFNYQLFLYKFLGSWISKSIGIDSTETKYFPYFRFTYLGVVRLFPKYSIYNHSDISEERRRGLGNFSISPNIWIKIILVLTQRKSGHISGENAFNSEGKVINYTWAEEAFGWYKMDDVILKGYIQIKCSNPGRLKRKVGSDCSIIHVLSKWCKLCRDKCIHSGSEQSWEYYYCFKR